MWRRTESTARNAFFFVSKRHLVSSPVKDMMDHAAQLIRKKDYEGAQREYQKVIKTQPNYAEAYDQYYRLQYKTVGPFGLTQDLFDHLQKKYLEAVDKYGEYREDLPTSPKV